MYGSWFPGVINILVSGISLNKLFIYSTVDFLIYSCSYKSPAIKKYGILFCLIYSTTSFIAFLCSSLLSTANFSFPASAQKALSKCISAICTNFISIITSLFSILFIILYHINFLKSIFVRIVVLFSFDIFWKF